MPPYLSLAARPAQELAPPAPPGHNEWQRWQHTFDHRAPVISVANLLLVFLLKLNRIVVPALVRWMRERRLAWIKRADVDVARELLNYPNRRQLCAGPCCRDTYGSFGAQSNGLGANSGADCRNARSSDGADQEGATQGGAGDASSRGGTAAVVNLMQNWVTAFEADETDSDDSDADGSRRRAVFRQRVQQRMAARTDNPEEDIYYRLRVLQEERHREMFIGQLNYSEVMAMYVTVGSLVLYWGVITVVVLTNFEFTAREAWVFAVALLMTGITSEIDTLIMFQRRVKAGTKHMLPEMPGYYALHSVTERTRLVASNLMDGVERGIERAKKRGKRRRSVGKVRRGPEVLPLNKTGMGAQQGGGGSDADDGEKGDAEAEV